jgi:hypothetical protein
MDTVIPKVKESIRTFQQIKAAVQKAVAAIKLK